MVVAETVSIAVLELLRILADRGVSKKGMDELHDKLVSAVQTDQRALEEVLRTELQQQLNVLRADLIARQETLRRDIRRGMLALGVLVVVASAVAAALTVWWLRLR